MSGKVNLKSKFPFSHHHSFTLSLILPVSFKVVFQKIVKHCIEVYRRIAAPDSVVPVHIRHHLELDAGLNHRFCKFERVLVMNIVVSSTMNEQ